MQKRFVVLSHWADKITGKPKSSAAEISEGISKATDQPYAITQTDRTQIIDGTFEVGTILTFDMTLQVSSGSPKKAAN